MIRFRSPPAWRAPQCRTGTETSRVAISDRTAAPWSTILYPVSTEPATTVPPAGSRPLDLDAFAHVKDGRLRRLLQHWLERRGNGLAPMRTAIDPTAIAPILASVWLCDYLPADRCFRMRLAGEEINRLYGRNVTQCTFEEIIEPALLPDVLRRYRRVVEEPAILHCGGDIYPP